MSDPVTEHLRRLPSKERSFDAGEFVFHQGDLVRAMYQILAGTVHLIRHQSSGAAVTLQRAGVGSILAEASLFSDCYHCDAIAVAPARTMVIAKSTMRSRLTNNADFAQSWAARLAHEVQDARLRAEILSLKTVSARLDAWIAWNGGHLPTKGEWKTVAAEIGTSPEALYRELAKRRRSCRPDTRCPCGGPVAVHAT